MMEKYPLNPTRSPIDYDERLLIMENWTRITSYFNHLQRQITTLAGGKEVSELLQSIEDAITDAENAVIESDEAIKKIENGLAKVTVAINNANTAKTNAELATNEAHNAVQNLQTALAEMQNDVADEINKMKTETATTINNVQSSMESFKDTFEHKSTYENTTRYEKNNEVLHHGSTFRAKQTTLGNPPPVMPTSNDYWQLIARRGEDAATESISIWRGATAPTNTGLLWFKDPNFVPGQEVKLLKGNVPPTDTKDLWLKPRGI